MASRTESRALAAIEELEKEHPEIKEQGGIHFLPLDLTDLESCQSAAREFLAKEERLDVLSMHYCTLAQVDLNTRTVNNAGVMAAPYELTKVYRHSYTSFQPSHCIIT
jgi:NAD(P)-dependent dehydrogenase (short-subunit alcohol dehydrogenase family)